MAGVQLWLKAFRLRTLPLAAAGIILGAGLAVSAHGIDFLLLFMILLTALLLQILSNLANDYGDFVKGTDDMHRTDRMMASGQITISEMKKALILCGLMAFLSGIAVLLMAFPEHTLEFWLFLVLGLLAIAAAINYTVGKRPYGYHGFGDLFVFLFFGVLAVLGSAFLLSQTMNFHWLLPASIMGFLSVAVLNINNLRDIESDAQVGKNTLAVMLGFQKAITYQWVLYLLSIVFLIIFAVVTNSFGILLASIIVVVQMIWWRQNLEAVHGNRLYWNKMLKRQAISTFLFALMCSLLMLF